MLDLTSLSSKNNNLFALHHVITVQLVILGTDTIE